MAPRVKPDITPLVVRDVDCPAVLGIGRDAWEAIKRSGAVPIVELGSRTVGARMTDLQRFVRQLPERRKHVETTE